MNFCNFFADPASSANYGVGTDLCVFADVDIFANYGVGADADVRDDLRGAAMMAVGWTPVAIGGRSMSKVAALAKASFGAALRRTVLPGNSTPSAAITQLAAESCARWAFLGDSAKNQVARAGPFWRGHSAQLQITIPFQCGSDRSG